MKLSFPLLFVGLVTCMSAAASPLDDMCVSLAFNYTRKDDDDRVYTCDCDGSMEDFTASCVHHHPTCWYRDPEASMDMYTVDFFFSERFVNEKPTADYQECLFHQATCNTVCVGLTEDWQDYATINGVQCQNVTTCDNGKMEKDNIYDCTNVVADMVVNMCTGQGVEGSPFEPWGITSVLKSTSKFEPGSCALDSLTPDGYAYDEALCRQRQQQKNSVSSSASSLSSGVLTLLSVSALLFGALATTVV